MPHTPPSWSPLDVVRTKNFPLKKSLELGTEAGEGQGGEGRGGEGEGGEGRGGQGRKGEERRGEERRGEWRGEGIEEGREGEESTTHEPRVLLASSVRCHHTAQGQTVVAAHTVQAVSHPPPPPVSFGVRPVVPRLLDGPAP